jgi:hypothetical protein
VVKVKRTSIKTKPTIFVEKSFLEIQRKVLSVVFESLKLPAGKGLQKNQGDGQLILSQACKG